MRLVHIVNDVSEEASGPSYSVVRLCESAIAQGHELTLASLDWAPVAAPPPFLRRFALGRGPRRMGRSPAMRRWLLEQARAGSVDLLHAHGLWMMPTVYPGEVTRRTGIPSVFSPRGTLSEWAMRSGSPLKRVFWPLLQQPALRAATCLHATAESEYEDFRRLNLRQPVAILPNGIDIPDPLPKGTGDRRSLLFLGRVHPKKGLDLLLPAWKAVAPRFPDWRLEIVGPDNDAYLGRMQELARELALERIEFHGALYGTEKWRAYARADLFVLPTYSENFGVSVAEALASGTPAIVSKGAPWSGLEPRGAGWWIDIGVDPLVACLEAALARSPSDLGEMGRRGREWMADEYSWDHIGRQMLDTYRWLIDGGEKPRWVLTD